VLLINPSCLPQTTRHLFGRQGIALRRGNATLWLYLYPLQPMALFNMSINFASLKRIFLTLKTFENAEESVNMKYEHGSWSLDM
jgi:hypothetical protein